MRCPVCETPNGPQAVRCKKCGKKLPRREAREEEDDELEVDDEEEEEEERPQRRKIQFIPKKNPKALIAYYLGVFSFIPGVGFVLGPIAFILGILAFMYGRENPKAGGTGHAIMGIAFGAAGVLFSVVIVVLIMKGILDLHRFQ